MLDLKFFLKEGPEIRDRYWLHIFKSAKDVYGKKFSNVYSPEYATIKKAPPGTTKKRREGGYPFNAPVFTGDLLRDYGMTPLNAKSTGFQIGWASRGAVVESLSKRGRVLTSSKQPLPRGVERYLDKQSSRYIKKKLGPDKTTRHKIGK